ncbi:translation initiation factor IF-2 [bacterium]|nr:translation initiation factor IF-2 [bacterium]NBX50115.1 translation initiation factor IF-2 [bacterium]
MRRKGIDANTIADWSGKRVILLQRGLFATLHPMNISELARQLRVPTEELRSRLPELGFDIGGKAIKIPDRDVGKIIKAWNDHKKRLYLQKKMEEQKTRAERKARVQSGEAERVAIPSLITVRDFATLLNLPVAKVMQELMRNGILASLNERIDFDSASIIAEDLGFLADRADDQKEDAVDNEANTRLEEVKESERASGEAAARPPVIVVMGHVDHGKTSLLDAVRSANVASGEAGGITQHIGAYQVVRNDRQLTFIDTPGHEAFTVMRSRGAKVADIAILVVAADDGVQPQTREAIDIIKAAKLPFVVAINKIDKPEANQDFVKTQLSDLGLVPEDWGGKTVCVPISAKKQQNIDGLLDVLLLVADMEKGQIVADPSREAIGTIIESRVDKNEGPLATIIVQTGTLRLQDYLGVRGVNYGRVRAMRAYDGSILKEAPPSTPVKILGFKAAPSVGDIVEAVRNASALEELKESTSRRSGVEQISSVANKPSQDSEDGEKPTLNLLIKADVLGSLEAVIGMIEKIQNPHVAVKIIGKGLGNVSDADALRAEAGNAIVMAFNVKMGMGVEDLVRTKNIRAEEHAIIYKLFESVVEHLKKLLPSEKVYSELGSGEVLALFRKTDKGVVLGVKVRKGKIIPGATVRIMREGSIMGEGKIDAIQVGKTSVKDVLAGQECGVSFVGKTKVEVGDIIEAYHEELQARTLVVGSER